MMLRIPFNPNHSVIRLFYTNFSSSPKSLWAQGPLHQDERVSTEAVESLTFLSFVICTKVFPNIKNYVLFCSIKNKLSPLPISSQPVISSSLLYILSKSNCQFSKACKIEHFPNQSTVAVTFQGRDLDTISKLCLTKLGSVEELCTLRKYIQQLQKCVVELVPSYEKTMK